MNLHYFTACQLQMIYKGLCMRIGVVKDLLRQCDDTNLKEEKLIAQLFHEAFEMEDVIRTNFMQYDRPKAILLTDVEAEHCLLGMMQIKRYTNEIHALWQKGGCKDDLLHASYQRLQSQSDVLVNNHFRYSIETSTPNQG